VGHQGQLHVLHTHQQYCDQDLHIHPYKHTQTHTDTNDIVAPNASYSFRRRDAASSDNHSPQYSATNSPAGVLVSACCARASVPVGRARPRAMSCSVRTAQPLRSVLKTINGRVIPLQKGRRVRERVYLRT
jgi:hypothetical protein